MSSALVAVATLRERCRRDNRCGAVDWAFIALCVLQCAAFWPVWRWYVARVTDPSDEPWGILALVTILGVVLRELAESRERSNRITVPKESFAFGLVYVVSFPFSPPLVHALLAVASIGPVICRRLYGRAWHPSLWGLLILSLPIVPTLQFYLGYPLRSMTAWATAHLLTLGGLSVGVAGAALEFGNQQVWLDAPCSGVKMFWAASYFCCALSLLLRLSIQAAFRLAVCTPSVVFLANVTRASFLFLLETEFPGYPPALHSAIGILSFTSAGVELVVIALCMHASVKAQRIAAAETGRSVSVAPMVLLLLVCASAPKLNRAGDAAPADFRPEWPKVFDGAQLIERPLSERERKFQEDFPGRIKRFDAGPKELIVRIVASPTRKLHPAEDCMRGIGYVIHPEPALRKDNVTWSCFLATRENQRLKICQRIEDAEGRSFPDAGSWYWPALFGRSTGPWVSYTLSEQVR
ncbi:MAG: archaeosortase/exosortase family protein [Bdellovibrionota bacterium]